MGSGLGIFPGLLVLAVFGCVPPLLSLFACRRRVLRAHRGGTAPGWAQGALFFSAAAFLLNLVLVTVSAIRLTDSTGWTRLEAIVLLIGWVAFWLWIVVILIPHPRHHRTSY